MSSMTRDDILNRLQEVFREVFDDTAITLADDTTAADIEAWDSLTNIRLLIHIEQAFSISFTSADIANVANVGELVGLIGARG